MNIPVCTFSVLKGSENVYQYVIRPELIAYIY